MALAAFGGVRPLAQTPARAAVSGQRQSKCHRPGRAAASGSSSSSSGSHAGQRQQQPVLDELMLALMQRRVQQGQSPLQQPQAQNLQPEPLDAPGSEGKPSVETEEDLLADLLAPAFHIEPPTPEAGLAKAAYADAIAQRPLASVTFQLRLQAQGQRVRVVGGHEELGSWSVAAAPELRCNDGDLWQVTLQLPTGSVVEYKYVLMEAQGGNVVAWQEGNNNLIAVRLSEQSVEVQDNWSGDMRGLVVADGGAPETREGRLLTWAGDLFAQLRSQRADLRRSRLEVAGAREAEQEAREEAQFHKTQSKLKEAQRAEAVANLVDAQALNSAMEEQLSNTTHALMEAIDTADMLLVQMDAANEAVAPSAAGAASEEETLRPRRGRRRSAAVAATAAPQMVEPAADAAEGKPAPAKRGRRRATAGVDGAAEVGSDNSVLVDSPTATAVTKTPRRQRAASNKSME